MRVSLLNPPFYCKRFSRGQRSPAVTKSNTMYYPIWLSYTTGLLEKEGFQTQLLDAAAEDLSIQETIARIDQFKPKLLVIETSTPSLINDLQVAESLKEKLPACLVALVGTHVSALPEDTLALSDKIDLIVRHEYDQTVLDLAKKIQNGDDIYHTAGISFKSNGSYQHQPDRPFIRDLDYFPFVSSVYKKHLKIEQYFNPNAQHPQVTIVSGRGCPFSCTFCLFPQTLNGQGYRKRSIGNVVDEMEYIKNELPQVKAIFFEDDTLTADQKRCQELSQEILKRNLKISWTANSRADVDYETLLIMKKAGLRLLCVGYESGNQAVLDAMNKKLTLERMQQFASDARKADVLIHGCFLIGCPSETLASMKETLTFAIKVLKPDTAQFFPIMVYPGTKAYDWYKAHGYLTTDDFTKWLTPEGLHNTVVSLPNITPKQIVSFCDFARRQFYLRPSYLFYKLKQILTRPEELGRTLRAGRVFYKHLIKGT